MATKKATKAASTAPTKVLSDKEIVLNSFKSARVEKLKNKFLILDKKEGAPVCFGLAESESDAWKMAAHSIL
jgi:hypothetical protein